VIADRAAVASDFRPDELRLNFTPDEDGEGYLFADVHVQGFAGQGSSWVAARELAALGQDLQKSYPLSGDKLVNLTLGYGGDGDLAQRTHIGLAFYPIGLLGHVGCRVSLATPVHQGVRLESQLRVVVELSTHHEPLATFARAVEMMADGLADEAILGGEPSAS
jgi:hypothetical protein